MWILLLGWSLGIAQAGFEGAALSVANELDPDGTSMTLDLEVDPWGESSLQSEQVWAPISLSWHFLGSADDEGDLDALSFAVLRGGKEFEEGLLLGAWTLGAFLRDDDDGVTDLIPVRGLASFFLVGDLVKGGMGLDLRARVLDGGGRTPSFTLGIPLELSAFTPMDRPPFAHGSVGVRPGVHLAGEPEKFQIDGTAKGGIGYAVVRGETVDFTLGLDYEISYRNTTARGASTVHTFSAGASARF